MASLEEQQPAGQPLVLLGDYIEYTGRSPHPAAECLDHAAVRDPHRGRRRSAHVRHAVGRRALRRRHRLPRDDRADPGGLPFARRVRRSRSGHRQRHLGARRAMGGRADDRRGATGAGAEPRRDLAKSLPGCRRPDIEELRSFLAHFGTYKADGCVLRERRRGRGPVSRRASTRPTWPPDTGNLAEVKLPAGCVLLLCAGAERLWNPQAEATRHRQLVYRIEDQGTDAPDRWRLALLHTVGANQADAAGARFVFFHAAARRGPGCSRRRPTHGRCRSRLADRSVAAQLGTCLAGSADPSIPIVGRAEAPYVLLIGAVTPDSRKRRCQRCHRRRRRLRPHLPLPAAARSWRWRSGTTSRTL